MNYTGTTDSSRATNHCDNCNSTGIEPACTWDVLPGEQPCDPPHPCHRCKPTSYHVSQQGR